MKRIAPLLLLALRLAALTLAGLSPALLPAASAQQMPAFRDNFDSDTVGAAPPGQWTDVTNHPITVRSGSTLSSPNGLGSGSSGMGFTRGATGTYTAGAVQLSFVVHNDTGAGWLAAYAQFTFGNAVTYAPLIPSGTNTIVFYNSTSGAFVGGAAALPSSVVNGGKVNWKETCDATTAGGPTLTLKVWAYGSAEPTATLLTAQDTSATAASVGAGSFVMTIGTRDTGSNSENAFLDDYFEGPSSSAFVSSPTGQLLAPNSAAIVYDKGTFALSATNATCADAGAKISVPFTGSQLALITNEGDGNQWIRYHVVTPGATAAQGTVPPWQTINLPAGTATTTLDSADADPTLQHTCYISFYRHGTADIYGSSTVAIPVNALNITGYRIDASATLGTALASNGFTDYAILMGDSIPEGYGADPVTGQPDATWNWVEGVFRGLKCNGSRFVHGGQGYHQAGNGGVPTFNTAYGTLFYGQSRLNAQGKLGFVPKYAILEHGVNGGATQADITTALTNIRAMTDPSTVIVQLLPLGGQGGTAATAGSIASFVASYKSATGDQNVVVADTSPYGISLALNIMASAPGFRGFDTLHPNNNQSGEIVGAVVGAIRDVTTPATAPAASLPAYRGQIRRGR